MTTGGAPGRVSAIVERAALGQAHSEEVEIGGGDGAAADADRLVDCPEVEADIRRCRHRLERMRPRAPIGEVVQRHEPLRIGAGAVARPDCDAAVEVDRRRRGSQEHAQVAVDGRRGAHPDREHQNRGSGEPRRAAQRPDCVPKVAPGVLDPDGDHGVEGAFAVGERIGEPRAGARASFRCVGAARAILILDQREMRLDLLPQVVIHP